MEWFDELQRFQLNKFAAQGDARANWLREIDAVYLYATIGHEAVLARDGSVRIWSADRWPDSHDVTEHLASSTERIGALVLGAKHYPVVAQLLPAKPATAAACERCRGSGRIVDSIVCPDCGGLGWVTPAT